MNEPEPVHQPMTLEEALREIERLKKELAELQSLREGDRITISQLLPPAPPELEAEIAYALAHPEEQCSFEEVMAELFVDEKAP
jgi:hypothetical protein